jgi:hypothetical protein
VEAAIHELMDLAWNVVYDLLDERGLLGVGFFVEDAHRYPLLAGRAHPVNRRPFPDGGGAVRGRRRTPAAGRPTSAGKTAATSIYADT